MSTGELHPPTPEEIRRFRLASRLTQEQLGERLGVDRTTVLSWEKGKTVPSGGALYALQVAIGGAVLDYVPDATRSAELRGRAIEVRALMAYALSRQDELVGLLQDAPPGTISEENMPPEQFTGLRARIVGQAPTIEDATRGERDEEERGDSGG